MPSPDVEKHTIFAKLRALCAVEGLIGAARPRESEIPVCSLPALLEAVPIADTRVGVLAAVAHFCILITWCVVFELLPVWKVARAARRESMRSFTEEQY